MAALATPKKNSYVVKKDSVPKIVESKTSDKQLHSIKDNAMLFQKNNLKKQ